jgi:hypothetical protein
MTEVSPRYTLRQLPLAAKLVVTLFMLSVGLGYFSALVQMHFQHTLGDGTPMPGPDDVIEIFAGKKKFTVEEAKAMQPKSKLETLVAAPLEKWGGNSSMAPAFFHKDPTKEYQTLVDKRNPDPKVKEKVDEERKGEQTAVLQWAALPEDQRKKAYEADKFVPGKDGPAVVTTKFLINPASSADGVKIKSIINARCADCHKPGAEQGSFPLDTYTGLAKYLERPPGIEIPEGATEVWCASSRQIGREKLAQSTHAHLLSFSMLFALTGFVFAFTSYPGILRFVLAPIVLLTQIADVSCWWLARLDGPGIYFAQAIMLTGGIVGMGLGAQIVLSVFNMYGAKGKFVLVLLFAAAAGGMAVFVEKVGKPHLQQLKEKRQQELEAAKKKPEAPLPVAPAPEPAGKKIDPMMPPPSREPSRLEVLLTGDFDPKANFNGQANGGMVRAFFDKDDQFKKANPAPGSDMFEQRRAEQALILAWIQSDPAQRKAAYEADKFRMPDSFKGKPFTPEFKADDVHVKVKTLIDTRCAKCHAPEKKQEDYPLTKYSEIEEYLKPAK